MGERNLGNFPISGAVCICGERSGSCFCNFHHSESGASREYGN